MPVGGKKLQNLESESVRKFQVNGFKLRKFKITFAPTIDGIDNDSRTVTDNVHNCWAGFRRYSQTYE